MFFFEPIKILNTLNFVLPLFWLVLILIRWFKKRELNSRFIKYGILSVIALFILQGAYLTIATYNAWKPDPISRYLLPPYNTTYFFKYAYFLFWRAGFINIMTGLAWAGFLYAVNRYSNGRILEKSDVALGFFTAMIAGWPKIFAYFALAFGLLILKGIYSAVILKNKNNIAITSSIAISALIVAGFGNFIMKLPFFSDIKL